MSDFYDVDEVEQLEQDCAELKTYLEGVKGAQRSSVANQAMYEYIVSHAPHDGLVSGPQEGQMDGASTWKELKSDPVPERRDDDVVEQKKCCVIS
mmetsp:Transcript_28353/g.43434  ORF Transcript_28353/g.43434 Transcript_28353/m.43434 type:complete len:95 (+) Transcript_28353:157-441(+)|eukprot:CAMPEP_0194086248 /NCGR_PEP_ID=MMETSP0149-20130528/20404_1 /TAXON_ID=122233 /ORGANISM="Chaetoceros debilis, Strain MM31A-1" /LENGTH=94 /DNA_ID=CAMNT_0038769301 /DNA_START=85 /DNA_END=369 /DNA_ORIENTATION=+